MRFVSLARICVAALSLATTPSRLTAQNQQRITIDDPSIRERRAANSISTTLVIQDIETEVAFNHDTVLGSIAATISTRFPEFTRIVSYSYLGQDGEALRFRFEESIQKANQSPDKTFDAVITLMPASSSNHTYTLVPEALQYTGYHFEMTPSSEFGSVRTKLVDSKGLAR
jgi:hypothetical protein